MIGDVAAALVRAQNPDGGWGWRPGVSSSTEPTAWAVMALRTADIPRDVRPPGTSHHAPEVREHPAAAHASASGPTARNAPAGADVAGAAERGVAWLARMQRHNGSFPISATVPESGWSTSLAVLTLADADFDAALRGGRWLLQQKGEIRISWISRLIFRLFPERKNLTLDTSLQGWSWTPGTSSWVEPTAYALLALKRLLPRLPQPLAAERISEAERMVYDRMCSGGGWNYGNAQVLGQELSPYPEVTAVTLLALQDHARRQENRASFDALRGSMQGNESGLALALAALCSRIYGADDSGYCDRLRAAWTRSALLHETKATALALLALNGDPTVLRVTGHDRS